MDIKNIIKKIKSKKSKIGIIGMGYVGLPLAVLFSKKKFTVYGFDIDKQKVNLLKKNKSYIRRIDNKKIKIINKKGKFFSSFEKITECDLIIICVPTPLKNNIPNLKYVKDALVSIKNNIRNGHTIVLESTSYPGTTQDIIIDKLKNKFTIGKDIFIGFSSERINPGFNENYISEIPKVLSGSSKSCLKVIASYYSSAFKKIIKCENIRVAEFSKLLENIYRSVNIGFINEMKLVADKMKLDIFEIIKVASTKPFGYRPFHPGPGIGGHCIPIDPLYLNWKASKLGIRTDFINLSAKINIKVINFLIKKINIFLKKKRIKLKNSKILILGMAYKRNIDDYRESASIKLIKYLFKKKVKVKYHDPYIKNIITEKKLKFQSIKLNPRVLKSFNLVILMTDHEIFNYKMIYKNSNQIIDCRGRYNLDKKIIRA